MARVEQVLSAVVAATTAGAGDTQIVAAPAAGYKIRVLGFSIVASAAGVNPKFKSGATDKTGAMPFAANGGVSPATCNPESGAFLFECNAAEALNLNHAAAGTTGGFVTYQVVRA
jgi:hypothetical protein